MTNLSHLCSLLPPTILSLLLAYLPVANATDFFFYWPTSTSQCDVVTLAWENGVAPFTAWVVPIYGQPFIYDIPSSAYAFGVGSYPISLQLNEGSEYVVIMSDANGVGTGGSSEIQIVGQSNSTACLSTISSNATSLDFTFTISGQIVQCSRGFEMSWSGGKEDGPYNATFIPLDQGFDAFDVTLEDTLAYESDWVLNMTAGSRFTVMMNSKWGYGLGGVTGIYQVDNSSDASCIDQAQQPTGTWPVGLATNSIDVSTLAITESAKVDGTKLSGGGIAGVVIGVLVAVALVALLLFFLLLRRRRRREATPYAKGSEEGLDLADKPDEEDGLGVGQERANDNPIIEPYRPAHQSSGSGSPGRSEPNTASAAGFAGLGAGTAAGAGALLAEEGREGGPGIAGPLPTKSGRPLSSGTAPSGSPLTVTNPSDAPSTTASIAALTKAQANDPRVSGSSASPPPQQPQNQGQRGGMQVVNHDDPSSLPALPPGAMHADNSPFATNSRRHERDRERDYYRGTTYRRHADAGRVDDVVDLPPLYTEVPRDGPNSNRGDTLVGDGSLREHGYREGRDR